MTRFNWLFAAVMAMSAPAFSSEPAVERYEGIARAPSGEIVYRERHEVTENGLKPLRAVTVYYDRTGREIGRLDSDFSKSPYAPNYRFTDRRTGKTEGAEVVGSKVRLRYQREQKDLTIDAGETLIVGQGLHHYVRLNLQKLARSEATVEFAIPSRLDTYRFRLRPLSSPAPGVVRLRIEISNFILRQLAPSIDVDYELSTRRLVRYRGVSNLDDKDGSTQDVVIQYRYGDAR